MSDQFEIDAPADMELLGGTFSDDSVVVEPEIVDVDAPVKTEAQVEDQPKRDAVIPRARFDDVNTKLHAQREENERLRAELDARNAPVATVDVDDLEGLFMDALLDGDKDQAKAIRAQINEEVYRRAAESSVSAATRAITEREAAGSFDKAVQKAIVDYPFLDIASPDANQEAIAEVVEWRDFYISKGQDAASALQAATNKIAPLYARVDTSPVNDERKQKAAIVAAKASASQPPKVDAGVGNRAIPGGDDIVGNQDKWEKATDAERLRYLS